ncbi:hypothetical protein CJU79_18955 [Pseudomonas fragi]|uniref:DUF2514 family protein n=1 Tax=Pseudomonas fragi TaxID=296 RepID=UPI000BA25767|nr:DUF2514 family protein [Pseudomonas fragi]PAA36068.1 hypothetical protein CJU79_18955 [Pseudomonas fragi]
MNLGRWLVLVVLVAIACFSTWKVDAWRYGKQLASLSEGHQATLADIATAATKASEKARQTEQQRQRDIDQVRANDAIQKQKDAAIAAQQRADNDSLRNETRQLLADKSALNTRLAERGKTIENLVDLLAELRSEADGYAGELAAALTDSRRSGFACERSYDAVVMLP